MATSQEIGLMNPEESTSFEALITEAESALSLGGANVQLAVDNSARFSANFEKALQM